MGDKPISFRDENGNFVSAADFLLASKAPSMKKWKKSRLINLSWPLLAILWYNEKNK